MGRPKSCTMGDVPGGGRPTIHNRQVMTDVLLLILAAALWLPLLAWMVFDAET